jgi:GH35 family endo-1,4-beta-xylanase
LILSLFFYAYRNSEKISLGQNNPIESIVKAQIYENMMGVCLQASKCSSFTTWGLSDRDSWIPYSFSHPDFPLLFDYIYRRKPAYDALVKVLKN